MPIVSYDDANLQPNSGYTTITTGAHAENVVFDTAASGAYEVWVVNFDGRSAGSFTIEVAGAVNRTFSGSLTATADEESERFMFTR